MSSLADDRPPGIVDADPALQAWWDEAFALSHPGQGARRVHRHGTGKPLQAEAAAWTQDPSRDLRAEDVYAIMGEILGRTVGPDDALPPPQEFVDGPDDLGDPADPLDRPPPGGPLVRNSNFWHRFAHAVRWPH